MGATQKKTDRYIIIISIVITYISVKAIYRITGFHYDFTDGIINIRFLIDIALWGSVFLTVIFLLRKLFSLKERVTKK